MKKLYRKCIPYLNHFFFLLFIGIFPCLTLFLYSLNAHKNIQSLRQQALYLKQKEQSMQANIARQQKLLQQLKVANRDYVEKHLESLRFSQGEIEKLQALLYSDPQNEEYSKRLQLLQSMKNTLQFREQNFKKHAHFQEIELTQEHSVEMAAEDVKQVLARVENAMIENYLPPPSPPDLRIKNFELIKNALNTSEEVFVIRMDLNKRERMNE